MEYEPQEHELNAAIQAAEREMKGVVVADWRGSFGRNDVVEIMKSNAAYSEDDLDCREAKFWEWDRRREKLIDDLKGSNNLLACLVLGLSALITVFIWRIS